MKILVVNCGSSSIKYKLYKFPGHVLLAKGAIDHIGEKSSKIKKHSYGIKLLFEQLLDRGVIKDVSEISAIGHRVVHGNESFREPHLIDKRAIKEIMRYAELAPLHNPANVAGIKGCQSFLPKVPQVAVFDTAFHQSIPEYAYVYAIPYDYYKKQGVRKYGFHGTSHQFVTYEAAKRLKKPLAKTNIITCHLGNGCSVTAVKNGQSIDTSMGFTPLEGVAMGTRCGDIDTAAVFYLMEKRKISPEEMDDILNKKSGLLGVSGISNDIRPILKAAEKGNKRAKLALEIFKYRIKKYIGAYLFVLGGADAVCFTGGIGENCSRMIAEFKRDIQKISKGTKVLVIPTDEELMIAQLTYGVVSKRKKR